MGSGRLTRRHGKLSGVTAGVLTSALSLAACAVPPGQTAAHSQTAEVAPRKSIQEEGRQVYEQFCASCHDTGLGGAPVTGEPASWESRSELWQAVLMEHAKAGYLDMPARGGESMLTDQSVSYAVEHMLLRTFPDKLPD